jgi:Zn-dependent protease with chaperone function
VSVAGSLVGFALVFLLVAWTLSASCALLMSAAGSRLRRLGPALQRRVATLAAVLPVTFAIIVVATLVIRSYAGVDHCQAHDHHAHLCTVHGADWLHRPWAVALVVAGAAALAMRLAGLGAALWRGGRAVAQLRATSAALGELRLVESAQPFCFVAGGRRPEIFVSTAVWNGLADDEREAMLAHERAHIRHSDLMWRRLVELFAAFGAPLTAAPLLASWEAATEHLRDADAASAVGDPDTVAAAMISMYRLGAPSAGPMFTGFAASRGALEDRVEALLAGAPRGDRGARFAGGVVLVLVALVAVVVASHAEPLHHVLETLLG